MGAAFTRTSKLTQRAAPTGRRSRLTSPAARVTAPANAPS